MQRLRAVVADTHGAIPGGAIDFANKMMKPVTNYWTTYRKLWDGVLAGKDPRASYQPMAKWVADNEAKWKAWVPGS